MTNHRAHSRRSALLHLALAAGTLAGACSRAHEAPHQRAADGGPMANPGPRSAEASAPTPKAGSASDAGPLPTTPMHAAHREIMGTWFEVKVLSTRPSEQVARDLETALDEIARLEDILSEWRPHTEISRINAQAGGAALPVGPETWDVLTTGQHIAQLSDGAFDMTWAALRGLYRFGSDDPKRVPTRAEIAPRLALVGYRDLVLDDKAHSARLKRPGMALGTGGIAKGYALDRVEALLIARGYPDLLLFAGGQVQVHGSKDGRAWRVGIRHPRLDTEHVAAFELFEGSVSTSGDYEHSYEVEGQRIHHIIDLRTGKPASASASVTLIARHGIDADALSTACFVVGPARCIPMLGKLSPPADAVVIAPDMSVHMTPGIAERVRFEPPLVDGRLPGAAAK
jgi:thiamine biosynthesis lipoprotein